MSTVARKLVSYQGVPMISGSLQDTSGMTFVHKGMPFVVANQPPGVRYVNDSLGRLSQILYSSGASVTFSYDNSGNRTAVTTS